MITRQCGNVAMWQHGNLLCRPLDLYLVMYSGLTTAACNRCVSPSVSVHVLLVAYLVKNALCLVYTVVPGLARLKTFKICRCVYSKLTLGIKLSMENFFLCILLKILYFRFTKNSLKSGKQQ